jgi:hypothetical protein
MGKRTLTDEEKTMLINSLQKHKPSLLGEVELLDSGLLSNETIDDMRDAIGSELMDKGFREDDEPNEYGNKLENLIDTLANLYWK